MSVIDIEKFRERVSSKYVSEVREQLMKEENKPKLRKDLKSYVGKPVVLTYKEINLVKLMLLKNTEIAERLGVRKSTVTYQIQLIKEKFNDERLDTNEKIVVMAIKQGLINAFEVEF